MTEKKLPPPPEKPHADECCQAGCDPCIFDYYYKALEEWEKEVKSIQEKQET